MQRMQSEYLMLAEHIDRARFWVGTLELQWANRALKYKDISLSLAHIGMAKDIKLVGTPLR
ncbi:hypothetical protein OGM63_22900 [Plectonema radiosum NIES-515]|uniref:Uncharacterized protein n=1 Tax=Plectonema radiosum NIES-515 TaxID=2986073 RepID=A0ABT3B4N1_9CYAN|nr:hypothetical protein [Plectonema radiosum]MCV3216327.1 hypothetical protein [Plectonema radiosum NIES-515]